MCAYGDTRDIIQAREISNCLKGHDFPRIGSLATGMHGSSHHNSGFEPDSTYHASAYLLLISDLGQDKRHGSECDNARDRD